MNYFSNKGSVDDFGTGKSVSSPIIFSELRKQNPTNNA
jgi:hypothetical protein